MIDSERIYIHRIFKVFLNSGALPDELPSTVMGFDYGDKCWNSTIHYLIHVVTDKDIRAKDPEMDEIMRAELHRMIEELGEFS